LLSQYWNLSNKPLDWNLSWPRRQHTQHTIVNSYLNYDFKFSFSMLHLYFNCRVISCSCSDGEPFISRNRILIHISWGLDHILIFIQHFLSVLKISKTFVFFFWTSSEYLTRYGQGSVLKTDSCLYFFDYSPDDLKKKTKVLDNFNTDKKCFMKINIE
jgi:hypothetical protein